MTQRDQPPPVKIRLMGFWEDEVRTGKNKGQMYLYGTLDGKPIRIYKNGYKESDKDPDWVSYIYQPKPREDRGQEPKRRDEYRDREPRRDEPSDRAPRRDENYDSRSQRRDERPQGESQRENWERPPF